MTKLTVVGVAKATLVGIAKLQMVGEARRREEERSQSEIDEAVSRQVALCSKLIKPISLGPIPRERFKMSACVAASSCT